MQDHDSLILSGWVAFRLSLADASVRRALSAAGRMFYVSSGMLPANNFTPTRDFVLRQRSKIWRAATGHGCVLGASPGNDTIGFIRKR